MKDKIYQWVAWKLPDRLVMWCAVRVFAHATHGQYSHQVVPELNAMDSLRRWIDRDQATISTSASP